MRPLRVLTTDSSSAFNLNMAILGAYFLPYPQPTTNWHLELDREPLQEHPNSPLHGVANEALALPCQATRAPLSSKTTYADSVCGAGLTKRPGTVRPFMFWCRRVHSLFLAWTLVANGRSILDGGAQSRPDPTPALLRCLTNCQWPALPRGTVNLLNGDFCTAIRSMVLRC